MAIDRVSNASLGVRKPASRHALGLAAFLSAGVLSPFLALPAISWGVHLGQDVPIQGQVLPLICALLSVMARKQGQQVHLIRWFLASLFLLCVVPIALAPTQFELRLLIELGFVDARLRFNFLMATSAVLTIIVLGSPYIGVVPRFQRLLVVISFLCLIGFVIEAIDKMFFQAIRA